MVPSETSVPAAGAVNLNESADTTTVCVADMPSARAVSVSLPPFVAFIVNAPRPCASVVSCVADRPFERADVIEMPWFAMPVPPAFVSTTE